jgi:hypothetical protein
MITSNIDVLAKELEQIEKEVERKLKAMVSGFAGEVALKASSKTPKATERTLQRYEEYYLARYDEHGVLPIKGHHAGSFKYTEGNTPASLDPVIYPTQEVQAIAKEKAESSYNLGDTFSIKGNSFAFDDLEAGSSVQAPNGIIKPTEEAISSAFAVNVKRYYDKG